MAAPLVAICAVAPEACVVAGGVIIIGGGVIVLTAPDSDVANGITDVYEDAKGALSKDPGCGGGGGKGDKNVEGSPASNLPKRVTDDFEFIAGRLKKYHGITREQASKRLHRIKKENGMGGADNVVFDRTGGVYNPKTGEKIGMLTEK